MHTISSVFAREILDSRDDPTVEVEMVLEGGARGVAEVPSGASTGSHEAVELRDGDAARYGGRGVLKAVENVNTKITEAVCGKEWNQSLLDAKLVELDGTPNKSALGANAILGVSMAFARAAAVAEGKSLFEYFNALASGVSMLLPVPFMNVINGGRHASGSTDFQEFMIVPHGAPTFREALRWGVETFDALKKILETNGYATTVGDEGGFAPAVGSNEKAVMLLVQAITAAGYAPGKDISVALDVAATELYRDGQYHLGIEGKTLSTAEMIDFYVDWLERYPIISIEDPLSEDDWEGYAELMSRLGSRVQIVGDDLFATNIERLKRGIDAHSANAILIKLNQIGTVTETIEAINMAKEAGFAAMISHRSGETEDTTIADFAVGMGTGQIKAGSLSRSERMAKYNQLLRIEEALGEKAVYAGDKLEKYIKI